MDDSGSDEPPSAREGGKAEQAKIQKVDLGRLVNHLSRDEHYAYSKPLTRTKNSLWPAKPSVAVQEKLLPVIRDRPTEDGEDLAQRFPGLLHLDLTEEELEEDQIYAVDVPEEIREQLLSISKPPITSHRTERQTVRPWPSGGQIDIERGILQNTDSEVLLPYLDSPGIDYNDPIIRQMAGEIVELIQSIQNDPTRHVAAPPEFSAQERSALPRLHLDARTVQLITDDTIEFIDSLVERAVQFAAIGRAPQPKSLHKTSQTVGEAGNDSGDNSRTGDEEPLPDDLDADNSDDNDGDFASVEQSGDDENKSKNINGDKEDAYSRGERLAPTRPASRRRVGPNQGRTGRSTAGSWMTVATAMYSLETPTEIADTVVEMMQLYRRKRDEIGVARPSVTGARHAQQNKRNRAIKEREERERQELEDLAKYFTASKRRKLLQGVPLEDIPPQDAEEERSNRKDAKSKSNGSTKERRRSALAVHATTGNARPEKGTPHPKPHSTAKATKNSQESDVEPSEEISLHSDSSGASMASPRSQDNSEESDLSGSGSNDSGDEESPSSHNSDEEPISQKASPPEPPGPDAELHPPELDAMDT